MARKAVVVWFCLVACVSSLLAVALQGKVDPAQIKKVHMIFMNHLDVGYDGIHPTTGFAVNVLNRYFTTYYPQAVSIAEGLKAFGYRERFVYTTHPWLLFMYLHCSTFTLASNVTLQCPSKVDVDAMRQGIARGDVVWHAGPMNMQYEVMHPTLLDLSLSFSFLLDEEFNITKTAPVVSQRDVPGMTKAVIPIMKKNKIAAISVGVNPMTSPPAVPRTPFLWKLNSDDPDEDGIIGFWHPGGYPDNAGRVPAKPGGLSVNDCLFAEDVYAFPEVLCFAFRTDNSGPPANFSEVLADYEVARGQFPNAIVTASTFDQYVAALKASGTSYPVVTQEIGDTWIMGIQSDPKKIAVYRLFAEVLAGCLQSGNCSTGDQRVLQAVHYLTKVPEHTWGLNTVGDFKNWTNEAFQKARSGKGYRDCEASWQEQRQFLQLAYQSLGSHPVTQLLQKKAKQLTPLLPDLSDYDFLDSPTEELTCKSNGMIVQFSEDGSLAKLYDPFNKIMWASNLTPAPNFIGKILYSTYNETDYDSMSKRYDYFGKGGAGFPKINSTQYAHPQSKTWSFTLKAVYRKKGSDNCDFMVRVVPTDLTAVHQYGAPPLFYIQYKSTNQTDSYVKGGVDVVVQWFNKGPTRLSESLSLGFTPLTQDSARWTMSKLGSVINPTDVILNGSQYLHAIDKGVYYTTEAGPGLEILSTDVALLTLGTASRPPSVFPVPLSPLLEPVSSVAFNLYNNLWSTNYIYWYPFFAGDQNFKARFKINFV